MVYFVSPTWREILIKAKEEYGDDVIHYFLSYHDEADKVYFRSIFYSLPPKDMTNKRGLNETYWEYITTKRVKNNPSLLKETEYLTVKFPAGVLRKISLYDLVFVICFFKLIYDDDGHYYFTSDLSKKRLRDLRDNLIEIIYDEFAKEYEDYRPNFPFCNREMMKPLIKGCLGYPISYEVRSEWTWVDNQFENAGIDVSKIQGKLWFERFWDPKGFNIKLMNWKRLPF